RHRVAREFDVDDGADDLNDLALAHCVILATNSVFALVLRLKGRVINVPASNHPWCGAPARPSMLGVRIGA
ncbi:MAG TPA: hypothetical protein VF284_09610, partial [Rhodanobacteraceae bacterium]